MHDVSNNLTPPDISTLFTYSNSIHHHHSRFSSKNNFYIKRSRINELKNSFSRIVATIWNSVPPDIRKLSKHNFKKKLHEALLKVLSLEDTYVDVSTLIFKLLQYPKVITTNPQCISYTFIYVFIYLFIYLFIS